MDLAKLTNRVGKDLDDAISSNLTTAERDAVMKIVQAALVDATGHTHTESKKTAIACCGHEADLAHKIQEELDKKRDMLITNLKSMR